MSEHEPVETREQHQTPPPVLQYPPPQGTPVQVPPTPAPSTPVQQNSPASAPQPTEATPAPEQPAPAASQYAAAPVVAPARPPTLLDRAKADDQEAIGTMFAQFLPHGEQIVEGHYLGVLGFWGIGTHSFAAVTSRRIATLRISLLGGVQYQDGSLEYVNSAAVFQPSMITLYGYAAAISLLYLGWGLAVSPIVGFGLLLLSILLLPLTVRIYYRFKKSGIVLWIREGLQVYAFIDRKRMRLSNQLYRLCTDLREERLRTLGHP